MSDKIAMAKNRLGDQSRMLAKEELLSSMSSSDHEEESKKGYQVVLEDSKQELSKSEEDSFKV
jgi:hypothetical protein